MKTILNETFEVDNILCINKYHNDFIIHKCIYISKNKFELQIMNTNYLQVHRVYVFDYIKNSGSILVQNGTIDIKTPNKDDLKVFFKNYKHIMIYKIDVDVKDTLNITIRHITTNEIIKEPIYIKYYNQNNDKKNNLYIRNVHPDIHTLEIETSFDLIKSPNNLVQTKYKIPRTIVQTYNTRNVNISVYNATRSWTLLNPTFQYKFFDDTECADFIKEHFHPMVLNAFNKLIPGAFKADLFRYCYLYKKGGVYSDIDNICLVSINDTISESDTFVLVKDRPLTTIFNAFMACYPGNPILNDVINQIVYNVSHRIYFNSGDNLIDALSYTGPRCLALSFNKRLGRPLMSTFDEGNNIINNMPYKLLLYSINRRSCITYNNRRIIKIKYNGYSTPTNYWQLCADKKIYR